MNKPLDPKYDHKTIKLDHELQDSIILSQAFEDMKGNPDKYSGIFKNNKVRFQYKLRHGKVSPSNKDSNKALLEEITQEIIKLK